MSFLPCDVCHETVSGKLLGFYMTVIRDGRRNSRRLKLCERDVENLIARYGHQWSDGFILNRFTAISTCTSCGKERGERGTLHPMYVTAYSPKGSRYDYYATYCNDCAQAIIDTFDLSASDSHAA